jgi:flagellar biosynthesis protein FliP
MESKWNWQKARISFKPGDNIYVDKLAMNFRKIEDRWGVQKTRKALKIAFCLVLGYLVIDLILNLFKIFV